MDELARWMDIDEMGLWTIIRLFVFPNLLSYSGYTMDISTFYILRSPMVTLNIKQYGTA